MPRRGVTAPRRMIIAQISDFHVRPAGRRAYGGLDTTAMLRASLRAIAALDPTPDCLIATGDLTDCGLPEEYAALQETLSDLGIPVFLIPGNHDRREVMRASLARWHPYFSQDTHFLQYVIDDYPVRLIALDTVVPGSHGGEICGDREAWLAGALDQGGGKPTLLLMHHPPFRTGVPAMDLMMCRTSPAFAACIARHPEIERVAAGHFHRPIFVRWAGTVGFAAPSTAHQVALDLREGQPTRFRMEPPAFALHVYDPAIGMVTHVVPVGDFGPACDFVLDADYPGQHA